MLPDEDHSAKYRNIAASSQVSFVVDDSVGPGPRGFASSRSAARLSRCQRAPAVAD